MRRFSRMTALLVAAALALSLLPAPAAADSHVTVWLDGRPLPLNPPAVIVNGRTLVPLRAIFEAMGAQVHWDGATQTVTASRSGHYVRLWIGNRLACLDETCDQTQTVDVPAELRGDRTFVPLRFVATAMGAGVEWDGFNRMVNIRSNVGRPVVEPTVTIAGISPGAAISGPVSLKALVQGISPAQIRWFLLSKTTGRGPLLAIVSGPDAAYQWRPDPVYGGPRLLAAVAYAADGRVLGGHAIPVTVNPSGQVSLVGPLPEQVVTGPLSLQPHFGFVATRVKYAKIDPATGSRYTLAEADPYASWTWYPGVSDNGRWLLEVTAYDRAGKAYPSAPVPVQVKVEPFHAMAGVTEGQTITGPVSLRVQFNYPVARVQFYLEDGTLIAEGTDPWASHRWFPAPALNGRRSITAVIHGKDGQVHRLPPVNVTVAMQPTVRLATVGKNMVITGELALRSEVNAPFDHVEYRLIDPKSGQYRVIASGRNPQATFRWTPQRGDDGNYEIQAVARGPAGLEAASPRVPVRVYTGTVYGPKPVVPKDQFLGFATRLAVPARERTGMSAALQVAQAILETGWGQYVPRDKYTGQFSNNLFGIKGKGPAGSIISNTWEEYGGVAVRVDDYFRAYRSPEESWADHKEFLLNRERYAPFRAVMFDGVQGAWALRRAGYATDSRYPTKLIDIMNHYNLFALDETQP